MIIFLRESVHVRWMTNEGIASITLFHCLPVACFGFCFGCRDIAIPVLESLWARGSTCSHLIN
jgi:hypothetical protein